MKLTPERLIEAARQEERAKAQAAEASLSKVQEELAGRRKQLDEVEQIAGKALGYPWFKDDQKNFPGSTEANGVCIGEHVAETIVEELANRLSKAQASLAETRKGIAEIMAGLVRGAVGGEDVVWFSEIETLWEFCAARLDPGGAADLDPQCADPTAILAKADAAREATSAGG